MCTDAFMHPRINTEDNNIIVGSRLSAVERVYEHNNNIEFSNVCVFI